MWFDSLMDDFKSALLTVDKYRGVFVPIFLKLIMQVIIGLILGVGVIVTVMSGIFAGNSDVEGVGLALSIIIPVSILVVLVYLVYVLLWAIIEVGSIHLYRAALAHERPTKAHFVAGIKAYLGKVFAGKLLIHFIVMITCPVWIVLYVVYMILIGIPTAGWGLFFLTFAIGAYFATWTIAIVHDDFSVMQGIKRSFKLARQHFKPMFIIILIAGVVTQYAMNLFGMVGALLAGWFISGVFQTYFKVVIYLTYIRFNSKNDIELI